MAPFVAITIRSVRGPDPPHRRVSDVDPRLRKVLSKRDVAVVRHRDTPRARRVVTLREQGVTTLYDIGANEGQYARGLRDDGYTGRIVSCEPLSSPFTALREACHDDQNWSAHQVAVGAAAGQLTIHVAADSRFSSASKPSQSMLAADPRTRTTSSESVDMLTLDELAAVDEGPVGVKIDVQGLERAVLEGAPQTLARAVWLELEVALTDVYTEQLSLREALCSLEPSGFQVACLENLMPDYKTGRALQANVIFVNDR